MSIAENVSNIYNWPARWMHDFTRSRRLGKMHLAEVSAENKEAEDFRRLIAADLLEIYSTHLVLNNTTYIRCIVGGISESEEFGLPEKLSFEMHERITDLSDSDAKIDVCAGLYQVPKYIFHKDQTDNYSDNTIDLNNEYRNNNGQTLRTKQLEKERTDMENIVMQIQENNLNVFDATYIITIMGSEKGVKEKEARVLGVLNSTVMEKHTPFDRMLAAYLVSRPYPVTHNDFIIRVSSETAALLCPVTTQSQPVDPEGFLFGVDIDTGEEVVINEKKKASRSRKYFGATGSGKSMSAASHLERAMTFYGCRGCIITPKDENENFSALTKKHGKRGKWLRIGSGEGRTGIPLLQIFYDEQTMGNSPIAYEKAYFRYVKTLKNGFDSWFENGVSDFAKGYLEDTINYVYREAGIIYNKPETWKNAKWPKAEKLYDKTVADSKDKSLSVQTRECAEALAQKLTSIRPGGTNSFLNDDVEPIDYSNLDIIGFDISGVDPDIEDMMYIIITGILGNRFTSDNERDTIIVIDEARVFLRKPKLNVFAKDSVALGRSYGVITWLITQNPRDFALADADSEMNINIPISIMMGCDIDRASVDDLKKYLKLTDSELDKLMKCNQGDGLLRINNRTYFVRFELTPDEYFRLKGLENTGEVTECVSALGTHGWKIKPEFKDMVDKHHIILKEMIEGNPARLTDDGWIKRGHLPTIQGPGSRTIWHRPGEIEGDDVNFIQVPVDEAGEVDPGSKGPKMGKMKLVHLLGVVESELYARMGGLRTTASHNNGPDLVLWVKENGKEYPWALEWTLARSASLEGIQKKLGKLLAHYKSFRFACSADTAEYEKILKLVGSPQYIAPRGNALMGWLDEAIRINSTPAVTEEIPWDLPAIEEPNITSPDVTLDVHNLPEEVKNMIPEYVLKNIYPYLNNDKKAALINEIKIKAAAKNNAEVDPDQAKPKGKTKKSAKKSDEHETNMDIENGMSPDVPEEIGAT